MIRFKNKIEESEVESFKGSFCNENELIIQLLLKNRVNKYFKEPILDVGSGMGDILSAVFPNKRVINIDLNDFSKFRLPTKHVRFTADFFNFKDSINEKVKTMFISHTLQFIDDDIDLLNQKISEISPMHIVTIVNENNDFMDTLIKWCFATIPKPNPEVQLKNFPLNYSIQFQLPFTATLVCPNFDILTNQVCYLMLIEPNKLQKKALLNLLKESLPAPTFTINQVINFYNKNEKIRQFTTTI